MKKLRSEFSKHKYLYITLITLLILVAVPASAYTVYRLQYSGRVYPGVYFHSIHLKGMSVADLRAVIARTSDERLTSEIRYLLDDRRTIVLGQVKDFASYDVDKTVENALAIGRTGSIFEQVAEGVNQLRRNQHVAPVYAYNRENFELRFNEAIKSYEKPVVDSALAWQNGVLQLTAEQVGNTADRDVAVGELERYLALQRESATFDIAVLPRKPEIDRANGKEALEKAKIASSRALVLSTPQLPGSTWTLQKDQIVGLMELQSKNGRVEVGLVDYKVASWSGQIAQLVNRDPVDAKFQFEGDRVGEFEPAQPGLELDTQALTRKISEHAFNPALPDQIEIPLKITQPALSIENVNTYGIKELVATGKSKFVGSPAGRIHNIQLAASKLNGVLIAPGETFSMYKVVGEVEKSTGYQDAFVILNGRTVPGVGGGLCQVSTTLFRAVLNAGLPIKERRQHAYRVYYYEQDSPPGIDAAVYFPTWDFKFVNDTANHLLLQTKIDAKKMNAEFNLYGVKDGRTVALTKPIVSNQSPPPPELRIDDPTLQRGQEKEVDHAVWGANTVFNRTVTKDGVEYLSDSFKSAYRPWQRVVMVGVKDN